MRVLATLLPCLVSLAGTVAANVEKTIFLGPSPVTLPNVHPSVDDLPLHVLSPLDPILPTQLPVQFPSASLPRGLESWYLLRGLDAGTRYEVRACWPATQPTDFWLDTYTLAQVFDTPPLIESLALYSERLQNWRPRDIQDSKQPLETAPQSILFLRVQAAASYYSTNRTLMAFPPSVDVDLILDPFLLNIFPRSLGPVAIYITAVAVGAWFLSGYIYRWLLSVASETPSKPHTD
ncbi:hypothetical protein T440DRAFT_199213 [Plenodomus tracheiphilus IPT5]|uniref:Protein PBN1 n=1 Tax=Plenodomus tracheiphilus IPT5 TaxID=1408161 RepID=A0A6A7BHP5_9PLEO|nr:hypothetical protein T440DRAFT_199213 [Plenodomus tracheiphilus IPT5]